MGLNLGATIGILGDGQLGRMLSLAAARLGFQVAIFGPEERSPAAQVSAHSVVGNFYDEDALRRFATLCDVVTFEWENIPTKTLEFVKSLGVKVFPDVTALEITQDRVAEKSFANGLGIKTAPFVAVDSVSDLKAALSQLGVPSLLKTRREGYDGKGQCWIKSHDEAESAFKTIGKKPAVLEGKAAFLRELSLLVVRAQSGEMQAFPLAENVHKNGILATTVAPAKADEATQKAAQKIGLTLAGGLDYVGLLAIELFDMGHGELWVNEMAPRVHNSGHWTMDGAACDQFEQHIRAVAGWPLGDTRALYQVEMTNLLGREVLEAQKTASEPNARLHLYGKSEPRAGRKMGHINRLIAPYRSAAI